VDPADPTKFITVTSEFGLATDIPTPDDYNGDGKAELSVYTAAGRKPPAMFRTEGARAGAVAGRAVRPQAAAMRLRFRPRRCHAPLLPATATAVGRQPPAMFRTEGARAGAALCPQAAAMRLEHPQRCQTSAKVPCTFITITQSFYSP
ncbi:MAG: hypothetical protein ACKO2L_13965, partial [Planctomycetaceae bacterium]